MASDEPDIRAEDAVVARLDASDRLLSADPLIARLQEAAGGAPDGPVALPPVVALARLARRLGVLVARPLLIGGPDQTLRLWARARPLDRGTVELCFSDWQEEASGVGEGASAVRAAESVLASDGAEWRTDAALRVAASAPGEGGGGDAAVPFATLFADGGAVAAAMAAHRPFFGLSAQRLADGKAVLLSGYPLFDADGALLGYRGKASEDEDAARRAEDAPEGVSASAADGVIGAEGMGGVLPLGIPDFGRKVDRALRQPLGRIIANAETISGQMEGPLRGDYAAYAADIAGAGRHLMELVDDLADLQAIDRVNFTVAREPVDLADIARRAAGLLGVKAADRSIRLVAPALGERAPAIGEFRRALQITVNLLNNAIRYSPEESTIWLRADVEGTVARLVVADQGKGIAPEDCQRVFEKFERLGRDDAAGSGLGLYISRRLARAMRGDLVVDSAPGQGARFILTLPVGQVVPEMPNGEAELA